MFPKVERDATRCEHYLNGFLPLLRKTPFFQPFFQKFQNSLLKPKGKPDPVKTGTTFNVAFLGIYGFSQVLRAQGWEAGSRKCRKSGKCRRAESGRTAERRLCGPRDGCRDGKVPECQKVTECRKVTQRQERRLCGPRDGRLEQELSLCEGGAEPE